MGPSALVPSFVLASLLLVTTRAEATYSLLIADRQTGLLGSVGTSCVGAQAVSRISGLAPGFGAIHAQAQSNAQGRDRGVTMLEAGASADEIIAAITAPSFDPFLVASRQYGVVTLSGSAAGYTGASNGAYADDHQLTLGDYVTSYQGNILTSAKVLDQLADSLRSGAACDLPETLMRALEAGAQGGEGDSRCTPDGIPADSGFLKVVDRDGKELIALEVTAQGSSGAVVALRRQFDSWRASHSCAAAPLDAGSASEHQDAGVLPPDDSMEQDSSLVDAQSPAARDAEGPAVRDAASATPGPGRDGGQTQTDDDDQAMPGTSSTPVGSDGGCSTTGSGPSGWLLSTLLVLFDNRRRRG